MAKVDALQIRLKFLKESSHLLALTSPTTSAVLGAERDRLLEADGLDLQASKKDWDAHRREVCGACGNLLIPGWTCNVTYERLDDEHLNRKGKLDKKQPTKPQTSIGYQCLRCERRTVQPLPSKPPRRVKGSTTPRILDMKSTPKGGKSEVNQVAKSLNAGSKQRAKTRKQSGLQAMLAKSKSKSSGSQGFGLDLMDLMQ